MYSGFGAETLPLPLTDEGKEILAALSDRKPDGFRYYKNDALGGVTQGMTVALLGRDPDLPDGTQQFTQVPPGTPGALNALATLNQGLTDGLIPVIFILQAIIKKPPKFMLVKTPEVLRTAAGNESPDGGIIYATPAQVAAFLAPKKASVPVIVGHKTSWLTGMTTIGGMNIENKKIAMLGGAIVLGGVVWYLSKQK